MVKLNTIVWTIWMLAGVLLCSLNYNPLYLTIALAAIAALSHRLKLPYIRYVKSGALFGIPLLLVNVLFIHAGQHVLFTIPNKIAGMPILLVSGPITAESIHAGIFFILLMIDMLLIFMVYQSQTKPEAVIRLIPQTLSHSALLTAIALRFIPTLSADVQSISEANRSRGFRLENTTLAQKIRNHGSLIIPALVNSLERSYNLAESLESRGYGQERTKYRGETWTTFDKMLAPIYLAAIVAAVGIALSGRAESWSPSHIESISLLPKANAIIILAILSLAIPGARK